MNIDAEWSYRKALPAGARWAYAMAAAIRYNVVERVRRRLERLMREIYRHHGPQGILARTWPTGSMAFWTTLLLGAYLIFYYL